MYSETSKGASRKERGSVVSKCINKNKEVARTQWNLQAALVILERAVSMWQLALKSNQQWTEIQTTEEAIGLSERQHSSMNSRL